MIVSKSFINTWFALQRQLIPGLELAYVDLHGNSVQPGGLVVTYPDKLQNPNGLAHAARLAQRSGAPVTGLGKTLVDGAMMLRIAYPLKLGKHADGAVVVEVQAPHERQAGILQLLNWGEAWLNLALSQHDGIPSTGAYAPLIKETMGQQNYNDALTVVLALLPERTGCIRVSVGRLTESGVRLEAVSEQAELDRRGPRVKLLEAAMQEALLFIRQLFSFQSTIAGCSHSIAFHHLNKLRLPARLVLLHPLYFFTLYEDITWTYSRWASNCLATNSATTLVA